MGLPSTDAGREPGVTTSRLPSSSPASMGAKVADGVASLVGSWRFIIIQSCILTAWITLNSLPGAPHWDTPPFILLNLMLSFQAAYSAPFIMMSQNRQAAKDRATAENDLATNIKAESEIEETGLEIKDVVDHLDRQDQLILQILEHLDTQASARVENTTTPRIAK